MKQSIEDKPKTWTTFDGRKIPVENLTHQHLSNIYYFFLLVNKLEIPWIKKELETRFNGQLLEYRPHSKFQDEITKLQTEGYLRAPIVVGTLFAEYPIKHGLTQIGVLRMTR